MKSYTANSYVHPHLLARTHIVVQDWVYSQDWIKCARPYRRRTAASLWRASQTAPCSSTTARRFRAPSRTHTGPRPSLTEWWTTLPPCGGYFTSTIYRQAPIGGVCSTMRRNLTNAYSLKIQRPLYQLRYSRCRYNSHSTICFIDNLCHTIRFLTICLENFILFFCIISLGMINGSCGMSQDCPMPLTSTPSDAT